MRGLCGSGYASGGFPDLIDCAVELLQTTFGGSPTSSCVPISGSLGFLKQGIFQPSVPLTVLSETPAVITADAHWGLGQVQAHRLLAKLLDKAKRKVKK